MRAAYGNEAEQILVDGSPHVMVFPNLFIAEIQLFVLQPLAVDRTKVSFLSYVWDPSKLDRGAGASLDRVEREDEVIVESVQRGVRGRLYDRGRYSPTCEQGVHHFHRLLHQSRRHPSLHLSYHRGQIHHRHLS